MWDFFLEGLEFSILDLGFFGLGIIESWLGGLVVVVGPGGQILTVDCRRVLNVKRSLYGSTSRVERSEPALYAAPTCTTIEGPVYVYPLYSSLLLEDSTRGYFAFCPSVRLFSGNKKILKKNQKTLLKTCTPRGMVYCSI